MSDVYVGAIPLIALLVLGVARGALAAREVRYFVIALLVMTIYALGRYTPVFAVMFHLPGVGLFRRPADATFLMGALAAIIAGYSVHRLIIGDLQARRTGTLLGATLMLAGLATSLGVAWWKGRLGQALPPLAFATAFTAASGAALWAAARFGKARPVLVAALLASILTVDLAVNNGPNKSTALPPGMYDVLRADSANATIAILKERSASQSPDQRNRIEIAGVEFHWPNASMTHRLDNTLGYNPVHLDTYSRATGAQDHVALPDQRNFSPLMPAYRSRLADLLGLQLIATRGDIADVDHSPSARELTEVARTPDGRVYENPTPLPRVLFPSEARKADFAAMIRTGDWPAFDPRNTVLLEQGSIARALAIKPAGTVAIRSYANTEVVIGAKSQTGGYVVLNDAWHPWWYATVDGVPAPVLKANVIFRAVPVPPGEHEVRFVFRPFAGMVDELAGLLGRSATKASTTP